jgi:hypothetical protein
MHPYQNKTNSPQIVALLPSSRAVIGSAWACTSTKGNTTARRMSSFDGHFTRGRHQLKVIAERDYIGGIISGLGGTKYGVFPGKMQVGAHCAPT